MKTNHDGTITLLPENTWTSCVACGQRVTGDSIHTCSPQTKPLSDEEIEKFFILESNPILGLRLNEIGGFKKQPHEDWIRVIFDKETAKMKFAEVLK